MGWSGPRWIKCLEYGRVPRRLNLVVRRQIVRLLSRALSLGVVAACLWRAWDANLGLWYVSFGVVPILALIWFPEVVDELTFGTWHGGYRIDAHTPSFLIALMGWILLFLAAYALFDPDLIARFVGMLK